MLSVVRECVSLLAFVSRCWHLCLGAVLAVITSQALTVCLQNEWVCGPCVWQCVSVCVHLFVTCVSFVICGHFGVVSVLGELFLGECQLLGLT